jgi:hypothetical protein
VCSETTVPEQRQSLWGGRGVGHGIHLEVASEHPTDEFTEQWHRMSHPEISLYFLMDIHEYSGFSPSYFLLKNHH